MARGDHISVHRFAYTHHGIDAGDGTVIHRTGVGAGKRSARVQRTSIEEFTRGGEVRIHSYGQDRFDPDETVARAEAKLDEVGYDLITNNCEHFACWCVTGQLTSAQVVVVGTSVGVAGASSVGSATVVTAVSASGTVAGLSGAGIMSGLATIGSLVGGGAMAGLALSAAVPAGASALMMNAALRDCESHTDAERTARRAGRLVAGGSAPLAILASVGGVSSAGTVVGLSGPGIASGLAAMGSVVGGGMTAGTALAVGLPAILAALLGYVAYGLTRWAMSQDWTGFSNRQAFLA